MGTPLAPGDLVITAASVAFASSGTLIHADNPEIGIVESLTPGTPPTAVTVAWPDGTRTLYPVVGQGATSVLYGTAGSVSRLLIGAVVQPAAGSGVPNPAGQLQGPVTFELHLVDPSGNDVGDISVVSTPLGAYPAINANLAVVG